MLSTPNTQTAIAPVTGTHRMMAVIFAAALGLFMLYGVGFAQSSMLHNAAHDARHATGFPCH